MVIYLLITFAIGCIFCQGFTNPSVANLQIKAIGYRPLQAASFPELERCLFREYTSFFAPMEKKFYKPDVAFVDPLTRFASVFPSPFVNGLIYSTAILQSARH